MSDRDDFDARLSRLDPGALLVEYGTPGALLVALRKLAETRAALRRAEEDSSDLADGPITLAFIAKLREIAGEEE